MIWCDVKPKVEIRAVQVFMKSNDRFVHFFNGDLWHNCVPILTAILEVERYIGCSIGKKILFVSDRKNVPRYDALNSDDLDLKFVFIRKGRLGSLFRFIQCALLIRKQLVFHSYVGLASAVSRIPNVTVSLFCWGVGSRFAANPQILWHQLKRMKSIYALMSPDLKVFHAAGLKQATLCPYPCCDYKMKDLEMMPLPSTSSVKILLGNSCWSIPGYKDMLRALKCHDKEIASIQCIVSYGNPESHTRAIDELNAKGIELFGERFGLVRNMMPIKEYWRFIAGFDVYISPNEVQGGLGVIDMMLFMGKKVFLNGFNYQWKLDCGCVVYHCNDLSESDVPLLYKFDNVVRKRNSDVIAKLFSVESSAKRFRGMFCEGLA